MESKPGTYALILESRTSAIIKVGRWGGLNIELGYYVYVGSAFGPGGVKARVQRHWRESKSMHWHIDYLRKHVKPVCVWYCYGSRDLEHKWANVLSSRSNITAIEGFGCSDCHCTSHLFRVVGNPCVDDFSKLLGQEVETLVCATVC